MTKTLVAAAAGSAALVLLLANPGFAKTATKTIQILNQVQVAGTTLKPGSYQVAIDTSSRSPMLDFYRNRKQVAQTPVKLVSSPSKNQETEVRYNTADNRDVITEIDLRGARQRILLGRPVQQ